MEPERVIESNWEEVVDNFEAMHLKEELVCGIYAYGFEKPSAIQQHAIMLCVKGHDVIVQSQSGTGKTATLCISVLQRIDTTKLECQALILVSTRDLALKIQRVIVALGDLENVQCNACISGTNVHVEKCKLEQGVHVVVGTPGRVLDMIKRCAIKTDSIKMFVLDEADKMMAPNFKDQTHNIFKTLNAEVQVILFSSSDVKEIIKCSYLKNPIHVLDKTDFSDMQVPQLIQSAGFLEQRPTKKELKCAAKQKRNAFQFEFGKKSLSIDYKQGMTPEGVIESNWEEVVDNFESMHLKEELLHGIETYGFEKPSAIQQRAIMACVKGHDVIVQSQSGTGKTATLCISVLQRIDTTKLECQALILVPTRELALKIKKVIVALGEFENVQCHACIGGTNVRDEKRKLEEGVHVVVGTPGRVLDMIKRSAIKTDSIKMFVLDEADKMIAPNFKDQTHNIFKTLNAEVQVIQLSAVIPSDIKETASGIVRNPIHVLVRKPELIVLQGIKQFFKVVENKHLKLEALCDMISKLSITQAVIFCNLRSRAKWLANNLNQRDIFVVVKRGPMVARKEQDVIMRQFQAGTCNVIITNDSLVVGSDIKQASLVINFELPSNPEDYIHRVAQERNRFAITYIYEDRKHELRCIEALYNTHIDEMPMNIADLM